MNGEILDNFTTELQIFFSDLNWTFVILYLTLLYGIKYKYEFDWYVKLIKKSWWGSLKIWIAGLILVLAHCIFRYLGPNSFDSDYVAQLLRSFFIVVTFNSVFTRNKLGLDKD